MITEVKLTANSPLFRVHEADRKVLTLLKVIITDFSDLSKSLHINVIDEKELTCFSRKINPSFSTEGCYEININENFQVINHLSVSVTCEEKEIQYEAEVIIE